MGKPRRSRSGSAICQHGKGFVLLSESGAMSPPPARLFAPDQVEIVDLDSWFTHAPPEGLKDQWKDGYSAKEQANAWLRPGAPAVPDELWSAIAKLVRHEVDEVYGRPEHRTKLDDHPKSRQHDMFACARNNGTTVLVAGIEAKACENFDGIVKDRAESDAPSKRRARCNLLAQALFGREVFDEETGDILDERLGLHGYQLWTAAVGTIIEAQQRGVDDAAVVVQQFVPRDLTAGFPTGDRRKWSSTLAAHTAAFDVFAAAIKESGSASHATEFVKAGTRLHLVTIESVIGD
jgi:hypothetical protein